MIPTMGILNLAYFCTLVVNIIAMGSDVVKKTYISSYITFIALVVNLASLSFFLPVANIIAIPIAILITSVVMLVLNWFISERLYRIGYPYWEFVAYFILLSAFVGFEYYFSFPLAYKILFFVITVFFLRKKL